MSSWQDGQRDTYRSKGPKKRCTLATTLGGKSAAFSSLAGISTSPGPKRPFEGLWPACGGSLRLVSQHLSDRSHSVLLAFGPLVRRNKGGQSTTKRTVSAPVRQLSFYFIPPPPCTSDASRPKGISTGSTASQGSDLSHTEGRPACCTLSRTISIGVRMCEHLRV